jgi:hypothetical protein
MKINTCLTSNHLNFFSYAKIQALHSQVTIHTDEHFHNLFFTALQSSTVHTSILTGISRQTP